MKKAQAGFTIVELLIVIVVIGILAAITIVAYNGIQVRAENAKTVSAIKAYQKGLSIYNINNGFYPNTAIGCLGEDYPLNKCWDTSGSYIMQPALASALKTVMGSNLPMPSLTSSPNSGAIYVPITYNYTLDGIAVAWIVYAMNGSTTKCTVGPIATYTGGVAFTSPTPASGQTVGGTSPSCWLPLSS